ncbi:MAG: hypothetical protein QOE89_3305 [Pseudonocardiales bacterium]|nr:hypothetical protein [Pseudonocardiales bacterium]
MPTVDPLGDVWSDAPAVAVGDGLCGVVRSLGTEFAEQEVTDSIAATAAGMNNAR